MSVQLIKSWSGNEVFLCARKDTEALRKHFFAEVLAEAQVFRNAGSQHASQTSCVSSQP